MTATSARRARHAARWAEFVALFGVLPWLFAIGVVPVRAMIPTLLIGGGLASVYLWRSSTFANRSFGRGDLTRQEARRVVMVFVPLAAMMLGLVFVLMALGTATFWNPDFDLRAMERVQPFLLVRERPALLLAILVFYPLVSVYPQEVLFRGFLFDRYAMILRSPAMRIGVSAVVFAWAHLLFGNVLAIVLTLVGGVLMGWTYERTRSLWAVWLEHALYGGWVFVSGLGWLFFGGSVVD